MQIRHRDFILDVDSTKITISSDFDSGNLEEATILKNKLIITPAFDPLNPAYSTKQSSKTFFHFKIATTATIKLHVHIRRMNILEYFPNDENFQEVYRICVARCQKGSWNELLDYQKSKLEGMKRVNIEGNYELQFKITVDPQEQVYLAYHYPYPYQKLTNFLQQVKDRVNILNNQQKTGIYFCNQLLTQSLERRSINLLTLTDTSQIQQEEESRVSKSIFPYYELEGRPKKISKPYIFFTCRVHSGETSSSFALQGIINFLLSDDKRAKELLKCFVFLFVPVLNPDGVFHGTYRMDTMGHNLNRFYNCAQSHKHPSIFAVYSILNYYSSRLIFFMDLHSHPHSNKGSFIYGNCLTALEDQTQSQLFAKMLQNQSTSFGYHWCSFSNSQMNSRDVNQLLTKDGSARVQVYKLLNLPFIYTMQMGYHGCPSKCETETQIKQNVSKKNIIFTIEDYKSHGQGILITIYNIFYHNCLSNSKQIGQKILQLRQDISKQLLQKEERFRLMDSLIYRKVKNINEVVYTQYYQPFFKKYPFIEKNLTIQKVKIQKGIGYHSISETINNTKAKKSITRRKQTSLQLPSASKTIDFDYKEKMPLKSFKSTIQPRQTRATYDFMSQQIIIQNGNKFAKQLNLNFNPFPQSQRRKIYNVIGNSRSVLKKNVTNEFISSDRQIAEPILNGRLSAADQMYKSIDADQFRDRKLKNFVAPYQTNTYVEQRSNEYMDSFWKGSNDQDRFILPKIPVKVEKAQKIQKLFDMEAQIHKQYQHKYRLHDHKSLTPVTPMHVKTTLRSNALKMRNSFKPFS